MVLKQKPIKMKKRAKVHMLPTDKESQIGVCRYGEQKGLFYGSEPSIEESLQNQHLYITTDDEIREGDWYVLTKNDGNPTTILKATVDGGSLKFNSEKIIATTDPELVVKAVDIREVQGQMMEGYYHKELPKPSKEFIEEYCKLGGIDEVDVEYLVTKTFGDTKHLDTEEPRVNSHNEITIHPIKDSWNREEVIALIEKHRKETYNGYSSKKWIKENL